MKNASDELSKFTWSLTYLTLAVISSLCDTLMSTCVFDQLITISADHHLEYSRAAYIRLRMNNSAYNGAVLKVVGLKLAKRSSVKVWGILVKNSPFCLKMSASGNSNCTLS